MIWTDWGSSPKIEKAALTGGQRVAIVTSNIKWPNGIELDRWNKRIYWVDAAVDRIESVDYNGNNRKLLGPISNFHGFGVTIIPPFLFFTDWASNGQIHQVDAMTGYFVVSRVSFTGRPMGIVGYDRSRQPPGKVNRVPNLHCIQESHFGGCLLSPTCIHTLIMIRKPKELAQLAKQANSFIYCFDLFFVVEISLATTISDYFGFISPS